MREIIVAENTGFCFGVARAVRLALEQAEARGKCYSLGPLVHNRAVVDELEKRGVIRVDGISEVPDGGAVVIRAHGAAPEVYAGIAGRGLALVDATCPDVKKIHKLAAAAAAEGRQVIIFGDRRHPEVSGTAGWCGKPLIISGLDELERLFGSGAVLPDTPVTAVSQTTAERGKYELCINFLKKQCTNIKIFDTICNATVLRQREAAGLAEKCDVMLVVGDPQSANTQKLYKLAKAVRPMTYLVENAGQAAGLRIPVNIRVGLIAGASAPTEAIKEVSRIMSDEIIKSEPMEKDAELEKTDAVYDIPDAPPDVPDAPPETPPPEAEENFEQMLEHAFKTLTTGDKVSGVITAITPTEIHVDLGTKHAGYISVTEMSDDPDYKPEEHIKIGDSIEVFVMRVNDVEGTAQLSKKRVDAVRNWADIEAARAERNIVQGIVTEENKGGLVVSVRGIRVFVPASQTGVPKGGSLSDLLRQKVDLYISEVNSARRRVVGNIRAAQYDDRRRRAEAVWDEIAEGKRYKGAVKSLTSYGAFVDIGGVDGMVHVSELSWQRVKSPADMLKVGDEIEVFVISFDKEKRKISLGHKDPNQNPWNRFIESYSAGDVVSVKVVKLAAFGAFCEIIPGVDGLIHISQLSEQRVNKPGDVLEEGQTADVKILEINHEHKKVSLSIRALSAYETSESDGELPPMADNADTPQPVTDELPLAEPEPAVEPEPELPADEPPSPPVEDSDTL
ncbi:MAG: bifunctional 4-hydroxy-3-methylbut-2-enyl diphosphate reductase/30S ribosomal protein S1 [Oscillospiraceae bacterium]|nr:bifunctional 4-hydroxy-3-methylbut-2-enyl diphosphate reductase/30S ribosomal protein S1 [Oscillospiraceae bacterium]